MFFFRSIVLLATMGMGWSSWGMKTSNEPNNSKQTQTGVYFFSSAHLNDDGRTFITKSGDGTIQIWDIRTGVLLGTIKNLDCLEDEMN
jgi:WD40 repeat protein